MQLFLVSLINGSEGNKSGVVASFSSSTRSRFLKLPSLVYVQFKLRLENNPYAWECVSIKVCVCRICLSVLIYGVYRRRQQRLLYRCSFSSFSRRANSIRVIYGFYVIRNCGGNNEYG